MTTKFRFVLIVMLLCGLVLPAISQAQDEGFTLTVMHSNDVHATYDPDRDDLGGAARAAAVVKQIRAEVPHSLLVDGGDRFTGSLFHSFYQGWDSAQVMNEMGYDAMVLGSYEFTHGAEKLADFVNLLEFPAVVANADFSDLDRLAGQSAAVCHRRNRRRTGGYYWDYAGRLRASVRSLN